jgi:hypothetical protein
VIPPVGTADPYPQRPVLIPTAANAHNPLLLKFKVLLFNSPVELEFCSVKVIPPAINGSDAEFVAGLEKSKIVAAFADPPNEAVVTARPRAAEAESCFRVA